MEKKSYSYLYTVILFILSLVLSFFVFQPYIISIIMAIIVANLLRPIYKIILKRSYKNNKSLASSITLSFFIAVIMIPSMFLAYIVVDESVQLGSNISESVQEYIENPTESPEIVQQGVEFVQSYDIIKKLEESIGTMGTSILGGISSIGSMTLTAVLKIFIFLYCIYFFLKDGNNMIKRIVLYSPLKEKDSLKIFDKFNSTTLATVKGTLIIGVIQGTLAGIGFFVAGIPGAIVWGSLMIISSAIPMVGATIIWIPVCIYLALTGDYATAIILGSYCGIVVGAIDNFLRPILVGNDIGMHQILVLISTLGGITLFGISGFIIGPTIVAVCIALGENYKKILKYDA